MKKAFLLFCLLSLSLAYAQETNAVKDEDNDTKFCRYAREGARLCSSKQFNEGLNRFLLAEAIKPDNKKLLLDISRTYHDLGDVGKEKEYLTRLIALDPADSRYYAIMGMLYYEIEDYSNALVYFSKALQYNKNDESAIFHMANIYYFQKNYPSAREFTKRYKETVAPIFNYLPDQRKTVIHDAIGVLDAHIAYIDSIEKAEK